MARRRDASTPQPDAVLGALGALTPVSTHRGSRGGAPPPPTSTSGLSPDSHYRGRPGPPLRARLETIRTFLADEDVGRCATWAKQFDEISEYLEWLHADDDAKQLDNAPPETRALFNEVVAMALTHRVFESHKHGIVPFEVPPPPTIPRRSTRLDWAVQTKNWPGPSLEPAVLKLDLPRPQYPRPAQPVNTMSSSKADQSFTRDTYQFWEGDGSKEADNLAVVEAQTFAEFEAEGRIDGVRRDANDTGPIVLPDENGTRVHPGDEKGWAKEHGARRVALQSMLRRFNASEQRQLPFSFGRVTLPLAAGVLEEAREGPRRPQWDAPSLPREQMPAQLENQPYLVAYQRYLSELKDVRKAALRSFQNKHHSKFGRASLPKSLVAGGPYIWRELDWQDQVDEDLLRQCRAALSALKDANRRTPRKLLRDTIALAEVGLSGELHNHEVPPEVKLHPEEQEEIELHDGERKNAPRFLSAKDVSWIKYLATDSWTNALEPNTPKDKYRLFLIFAARVKKLLNDRNPNSLFGTADTQVTIEQLLEVLNAGVGNSAVDKVEFGPFDAVAWLTRLGNTGHVLFHRDISCYGVISRPRYENHPEDRVEDSRRPQSTIGTAGDNQHYPRASASVVAFFKALGYRLGYTIYLLDWARKESGPSRRPHASTLEKDIRNWGGSFSSDVKAGLIERLKKIDPNANIDADTVIPWVREKIIDEISANDTMLAPGREKSFRGSDGKERKVFVRDHNWEWASEQVRQRKVPRFMDVNRWPQGHGYLSSDEKQAYDPDSRLDPANNYDPSALDPIEQRFRRPRLKRYGEDRDLVQFRAGRPVFPIGDTRHQQRVIEEYMTDMAHEAIGLPRKQSWGAVFRAFTRPLKRLFPFQDEDDDSPLEHPPLKSVKLSRVPKSWSPEEEALKEAARQEEARARARLDDDMDIDDAAPDGYDDLGLDDEDDGDDGGNNSPGTIIL
ncbi:hypothetical protein B0T14DRAFT_415933 [Immersiella caudata]|uniref:Uncharacterized protein n=1 Tax=Immersiella caudata TaxID=314043 RepID=A0AA40CAN9_9PEZI|nr:hypothetical protein B0T14DRAFT_415933 [Immersiella caudata]